MKTIYYVREFFKDGATHEMKIGKQMKRAKDTAERALKNELVNCAQVISYRDGFSITIHLSVMKPTSV